jgi:formyltetrahydrofolate deformylase
MRVHFAREDRNVSDELLRADFAAGRRHEAGLGMRDAHYKPRVMLMVSKIGHCLNDLLFRYKSGLLPVEIPAIVSNHMDFYQLAASYNIPFHHLPLATGAPEAKLAQEAKIIELMDTHKIDLVVLARYMQILSPGLCRRSTRRSISTIPSCPVSRAPSRMRRRTTAASS